MTFQLPPFMLTQEQAYDDRDRETEMRLNRWPGPFSEAVS